MIALRLPLIIGVFAGLISSALALSPAERSLLLSRGPKANPLVAALPAGAVGVWAFDSYQAAPSPAVANLVNQSTPLSVDLFRAPRHLYSNAASWASQALTITDDAAAGPDGATDASTIVSTSNSGWVLNPNSSASIPAGTYTIAISAQSGNGSAQSFAFSKSNGLGRDSVQNVPASGWGRYSYTFTNASAVSANYFAIWSSNGSTGINLQIRDFDLFPGGIDLGGSAPVGDIYLGASFGAPHITAGTGYVDLSAGGFGLAQFPSWQTYSTYTVEAVISQVAADGLGYDAALSKVQNYSQFTAYVSQAQFPSTSINGGVYNREGGESAKNYSGLWNINGAGYHLFTQTYDGIKTQLYLDDVRMFVDYSNQAAPSLRDFAVNFVNASNINAPFRYAGIALWNRGLSPAEISSSANVWNARLSKSGLSLPGLSSDRVLVVEGDSITNAFSYSYPYQGSYSPSIFGSNFAVEGSGLSDIALRQPYELATIPASPNGRKFIWSILDGANDLCSVSCAAWEATYQTLLTNAHNAGFKTVCVTILPVSGNATFNSNRAIVNSVIRGWLGTYCDAISDFAANATMGVDNSYTLNPSDWGDGTHPSSAGMAILAPIYAAAVDGF